MHCAKPAVALVRAPLEVSQAELPLHPRPLTHADTECNRIVMLIINSRPIACFVTYSLSLSLSLSLSHGTHGAYIFPVIKSILHRHRTTNSANEGNYGGGPRFGRHWLVVLPSHPLPSGCVASNWIWSNCSKYRFPCGCRFTFAAVA